MLICEELPVAEIQEVWQCKAGHAYQSPKPLKLEAVVCPHCVVPYKGNKNERAGIDKWNMKKVKERSRNGRLVNV